MNTKIYLVFPSREREREYQWLNTQKEREKGRERVNGDRLQSFDKAKDQRILRLNEGHRAMEWIAQNFDKEWALMKKWAKRNRTSVTSFGDLLNFGQVFKASGSN